MNEINNDDENEFNKGNLLILNYNKNQKDNENEENMRVNNITFKKVDENFSNAQKVEINSNKGDEKNNTEKSIKEIQEVKSIFSEESDKLNKKKDTSKKKLRTQSTKAPPGMLKKNKDEKKGKKKSGLFLCCIPRSSD